MKEPAHLRAHPFGQIPTYEEGDLALFETGAIVFHIAERHAGLLPADANARARAITWMFAAVNTVEPPILDLVGRQNRRARSAVGQGTSAAGAGSHPEPAGPLSARLGDADWLDGAFSAGDLMMVSVLLRLRASGHSGRISESRRVCRARRSAACLPARVRCAAGGEYALVGIAWCVANTTHANVRRGNRTRRRTCRRRCDAAPPPRRQFLHDSGQKIPSALLKAMADRHSCRRRRRLGPASSGTEPANATSHANRVRRRGCRTGFRSAQD